VSRPRVIRAADCPPTAWKNGGGTTRQLAVFPPGAGIDDFLWRISIAQVDKAGPFSVFPGIDRVLAVVRGTLRLTPALAPDLGEERVMTSLSAPYAFDGASDMFGEPLGGPAIDVNVMARRGRCAARMRFVAAGSAVAREGTTFLTALHPVAIEAVSLAKLDTLCVDEPFIAPGRAVLTHLTMA
jgi:environmental stress-induced protein Ves